jgi:uncharacterized membrane protein
LVAKRAKTCQAPAETATARNLRLEQFVGAKLFAWLGGLALFFAAALGLKYSFDHNLLPPWVRAVAGAVLGIGLLVGGTVMNRRRYPQTATTLWATGIVILYAVTFACRSLYAFPMFTTPVTFAVMVLITALAFGLAVSFETQIVAVLGMLGGFLTPVLVSSGQDQALALFSYIAVLDVGLIAVAWRRRWDHLTLLAAVGTVVMQLGWYTTSFQPTKIDITQMHLALFPLLFTAALSWAHRAGWANRALTLAAVYLGIGQAALDAVVHYAKTRVPTALGKPIATLPLIQRRIGEASIPLQTARALLHDVAATWSNDPAARLTLGPRIAAAKYAATNAAVVATDHALRAAGGFGITRDLPLERFFRDARAGLTHPPNDDAALEMVGRSLTQ